MKQKLDFVDEIIHSEIKDFATKFKNDYCSEKALKRANIINKKNNIFIAALGNDVLIYSALMRSLDSSLGNRLEKIAKLIAEKNYIVKKGIEGYMPTPSLEAIAKLLDKYHTHVKKPEPKDIELIYTKGNEDDTIRSHEVSDYFLTLKTDPTKKFLIELKIGGDLDNKKAESEKRALLQQYVVLRNSSEIKEGDSVQIFFCTAYNKNGENATWTQERVKQFFAESEIKIGKEFWNFFCNSDKGYEAVKLAYQKHSHYLKDALEDIVKHFS